MYRHLPTLFAIVVFMCLSACLRVSEKNASQLRKADYIGEWEGALPCADCDAVEYLLILNKDQTYEAVVSYLGVGQADPDRTTGKWTVSEDRILIMDGELKDTLSLLPEGGALTVLGPGGQRMSGPEAKYYKLSRKSTSKQTQIPKMANEYGFNASGTAPEWQLQIIFDKYIRFKTPDGDTIAVPVPPAQTRDLSGLLYAASGDNNVSVVIDRKDCSQGDEKNNYSVTVTVDTTVYTGCGKYTFDDALTGTWVLTGIDGLTIDEKDFSRGTPEIRIGEKGMSVSGSTGCNTYNGVLWIEGQRLRINGISLTRMICPGDMESRFVEMLENRPVYTLEEGQLTLKGPTSSFIFTKNPTP